jgi:hypothetical protein
MSRRKLKAAYMKSERISFIFPVTIGDLLGATIDGLNNRVEEACVGDNCFMFENIAYVPVEVRKNIILIEVSANLEAV